MGFKPAKAEIKVSTPDDIFQGQHISWDVPGESDQQRWRKMWILSTTQISSVQFSSVQSLSRVQLFVTPWITARQASMSITNSRSSPRLTSIESVMPSSHLILCRALLLLPSIFPSIRVFSNESTLHMRWPKYWSFSFSIIPSKEIPGLPQMISVLEFSPQLLWGTVASQESLSYGTYHSLQ